MSGGEEAVFVYGALRRDGEDVGRMQGGTFVRDGRVKGRLYAIGGSAGWVDDRREGSVVGELWSVSPAKLAELDERMSAMGVGDAKGGFRRRRVAVSHLEPQLGDLPEAWAWEWTGAIVENRRVRSGDWMDVVRPRPAPVLTSLGCLSFVAMPIGVLMLVELAAETWPAGSRFDADFWGGLLVWALVPVGAWGFATIATRRRERGAYYQDLARGVARVWVALFALVVFFKGLAWCVERFRIG